MEKLHKVLVVDDEDDLRELVCIAISAKFEVELVEASSGNQAVEKIKEHADLRLVVSDYQMRNGCGDVVFNFLQKDRPKVPFILVSSDPPQALDAFAEKSPAAFVQKPNIVDGLVAHISKILGIAQRSSKKAIYLPVRMATLFKLSQVACDLYLKLGEGHFVKVHNEGAVLTEADRQNYQQKNVQILYASSDSVGKVLNAFQQNIALILKKRKEELGTQFTSHELISEVMHPSMDLVRDVVSSFGWGESLKEIVAENISLAMSSIKKEKKLSDLLDRLTQTGNGDLATLCSSIAFVGCGIAQSLGKNTSSTCEQLTMACFLQESLLSESEIVNFNQFIAQASDPQFSNDAATIKFKQHCQKLNDLVSTWKAAPKDIETILFQHHEKPDGSGFPMGIQAEQFHPTSAILVVAFDLVFYYQNAKGKADFSQFISERAELYSKGPFRSVLSALMMSMAPKA